MKRLIIAVLILCSYGCSRHPTEPEVVAIKTHYCNPRVDTLHALDGSGRILIVTIGCK